MHATAAFCAFVSSLKPYYPACCRFMPGVDVRYMLIQNPSVVLSVQRGTASLGPGAEFC